MKVSAGQQRPREAESMPSRKKRASVPPIPGFTPRAEDAVAHALRGVAPQRVILAAGLISALVYAGFALAFPITQLWSHPRDPNDPSAIYDLGHITQFSPIAAALFIIAILTLFAAQFLALTGAGRLVAKSRETHAWDRRIGIAILVFPIVFAAIMVWMQPVTTTDLYGYVARGYLYAQLHQNPMTMPATQLPGGFVVDRPAAPYGPAWLLLAGLISSLFRENLLAYMLAFKAIEFVSLIAAVFLVDHLAKALAPERRWRVNVLFGWSPLLLFESIGNGHNDLVMVVCVLAAFAVMLRGRSRTAFTLLVLGALVKYVSAVFVPLWLAYELRHRLRPNLEVAQPQDTEAATRRSEAIHPVRGWIRALAYTLTELDYRAAALLIAEVFVIGAVLVVAFYAPFWQGFHTFTGLGQQLRPRYYNSSIVGLFSAPFQIVFTQNQYIAFDKTVRLVVYALFGLYAYIQTQRIWMLGATSTLRDVVTAAAKITFAALILITFWFQPWYVVWVLPLAALSAEPFVRRQGTMLAAGALMTYAVANYLLVGTTGLGRDLFVQFFEILVAFGPLLLLRAAPYDKGWISIARRYSLAFSITLERRPQFWRGFMLGLIVIVAAILRLVRLGNLFGQVPSQNAQADILKQLSGELRLVLSDPQGLHGPFAAIEGMFVQIFGPTPFAVLLPSAILGSVTVVVIGGVAKEILRRGGIPGAGTVSLLAALLAATSSWHVSLSRSGMEVVLLPLLLCLALYLVLRGLHAAQPHDPASSRLVSASTGRYPHSSDPQDRISSHRQFLYFTAGGVAAGLGWDVVPGLWLVPLILLSVLIFWRLSERGKVKLPHRHSLTLVLSTAIAAIPVGWYYISLYIGFPTGSALLAKSSEQPGSPSPLSGAFWAQVASNAGDVIHVLIAQDYSAGYPSIGGAPIIPGLLGPFFYIGVLIIVIRWRTFAARALFVLLMLPLLASVAVGTPTSLIEAASILPAMCIIPALGIYQVVSWLGHLPIVLDRINGVRVFSTPEQIGRVLLLMFLVVSAIRTFFWYFEATLPSAPTQQFIPAYTGANVAYQKQGDSSQSVYISILPGNTGEHSPLQSVSQS